MQDHASEINFGRSAWSSFSQVLITTFVLAVGAIYSFVVLLDPYDVIAFSLPIERRIVSISQRHMYHQIITSRKFDSIVVGTSTSRLLDPKILDEVFDARFANLAMDSATAWEQYRLADYFIRRSGSPKVLLIGLDRVWCDANPRRYRTPGEFPEWMYDDNRWNDLLYLLNSATVEIAGRLVGYHLGLYPERIRGDGFQVFVPPESEYDVDRARRHIWNDQPPRKWLDVPGPVVSDAERQAWSFPALAWLDSILAELPNTTKVLAYMPVHIASQPEPGTLGAAQEQECKRRIASIAGRRGAKVVDWRIPSPITTDDANYWDSLHFRLPVAEKIARALAPAVLENREAPDESYRLVR